MNIYLSVREIKEKELLEVIYNLLRKEKIILNNRVSVENTKQLLTKVPEITIYFWIIKLLSTAMGEATSDYLVFHVNQYLAVILGTLGFIVALILQFKVNRYIPWVYWLMVCMVSIFGTMLRMSPMWCFLFHIGYLLLPFLSLYLLFFGCGIKPRKHYLFIASIPNVGNSFIGQPF